MPKYDRKQVSQINNENIKYACAYRENMFYIGSKTNLISLCHVQKFSLVVFHSFLSSNIFS